MGDYDERQDKWFLTTALFPKDESIFRIDSHIYTLSTGDGGLVPWLPRVGDRQLRILHEDDGSDKPNTIEPEQPGPNGDERLRAQCHCGGVSFTIGRPSAEDLADKKTASFVSPIDKTKWVACLDACNDCRLNSGVHIAAWTFVPRTRIEPPVGPGLRLGTMKTYSSSEGVLRSFCGVCGATVFFSAPEDSPVIDLSLGILRAPEGARAENWVTWRTHKISYFNVGCEYDKELYETIAEELGRWGENTYKQKLDFLIGYPD